MTKTVNNLLAACVLFLSLAVPSAMAQQGVSEVSTENLKTYPHRYWAKRVVFRDKLTTAPQSSTTKIKGNRYYETSTEALGKVYLTEDARNELDAENSLNREFLFRGTVLNKGTIIGKDRFYFIVETVIQKIDPTADIEDSIEELVESPAGESSTKVRRFIGELIYSVQSACLVYTTEQEIDYDAIFDPNSPHHDRLIEISRNVISSLDRQGSMTPEELMSQMITLALKEHYNPGEAEQLPDAASGFQPVPEPEENPELTDFLPTANEDADSEIPDDMVMEDKDPDMGEPKDMEPMASEDSDTKTDTEIMTTDPGPAPSKPALGTLDAKPEDVTDPAPITETSKDDDKDTLHDSTRELLESLEDDSLEEPEPLELDLDFDF